jgi:tetratricopeptide (TPR) repeat protein
MKFSKSTFILIILSTWLVSACSSVDLNRTPEKTVVQTTPVSQSNTEQITTNDPWQQLVFELQAQPNQYRVQGELAVVPLAAQNQFEQGLSLMKQQQLAAAHELYMSLSRQYPTLSGVWLQLAEVAQLQNNLPQAMDYLQKCISVNNSNYLAHNRIAVLYRQQGQFNLALQHYNLALASWPAFAQGHLNRGILHDLYLGNKTQALEDYQVYQALVLKPDRQVKGWIADLERQIQAQEKAYNATSGTIKGDIQ